MTPENKILAEKVIEFFKKSDKAILSPGRDIQHLLKDANTAKKIITPLEKDYGLIERSGKESLRLTDKGWKFTTFDKLEKDSKKTPLSTYQKIYLSFFILFGLFGIFKVFQPSVPISDFKQLQNEFQTLNSKFESLEKSKSNKTLKQLKDTLERKPLKDSKAD